MSKTSKSHNGNYTTLSRPRSVADQKWHFTEFPLGFLTAWVFLLHNQTLVSVTDKWTVGHDLQYWMEAVISLSTVRYWWSLLNIDQSSKWHHLQQNQLDKTTLQHINLMHTVSQNADIVFNCLAS